MALTGARPPRALVDLISRNRRRYGGYIVHLAVVLLVVGIIASSSYASVASGTWRVASAWSSTATG